MKRKYLPTKIYPDCGSFAAADLDSMLLALGFRTKPSYNPSHKALIERSFLDLSLDGSLRKKR